MHPPSIVEMKHGHICKHSKIFLKQQENMEEIGSGEQPTRKGVFYHPKIECKAIRDCEVAQTLFLFHSIIRMFQSTHAGLDTHPARMNTHLYTVYGGAAQDHGRYVYLIDEHKKK